MKRISYFILSFIFVFAGLVNVEAGGPGIFVSEEPDKSHAIYADEIEPGIYSYKDGSFIFDQNTETLTLDNYHGGSIQVGPFYNFKLVLKGDNVLDCADVSGYCLQFDVLTSMTGDGTLTINGKHNYYDGGIRMNGNFPDGADKTILIDTGKITIDGSDYAFSIGNDVNLIIASDLDIKNANVAIGKPGSTSCLTLNSNNINIDVKEIGIITQSKIELNVNKMDVKVADYQSLEDFYYGGIVGYNNISFNTGSYKIKTMAGIPTVGSMYVTGESQEDYEGIIIDDDLTIKPSNCYVLSVRQKDLAGYLIANYETTHNEDTLLFDNICNEIEIVPKETPKVEEPEEKEDVEPTPKEEPKKKEKENPKTGSYIVLAIPLVFISSGLIISKIASKRYF